MIETITLNVQKELVFIDHYVFTDYLKLTGQSSNNYRHFLKNIFPQFIKDCRQQRPTFCLYLTDFSAHHLIQTVKNEPELEEIVSKYISHKFIKQYETTNFLPEGKKVEEGLSFKEEQVFYKTLLDDVRRQNMTKEVLLITGFEHAIVNGDGLIDAGISRIGCYTEEDGFIEFKEVKPEEGDIVYIDKNPIRLGKKMSAGGEAAIFDLGDQNPDFIAKIYCTSLDEQTLKPNCVKFRNLMMKRSDKLNEFFSNEKYRINDPQLIFPLVPITDEQGVLIGVIMRKVTDGDRKVRQLHDIIMNDNWPFEGFTRLDLLKIARQIVKKVKKVHDHGIIIGDINLRNFLVTGHDTNSLRVYLIDLDGCQIEGHPSYYETPNYRDPLWSFESNQPRTFQNEVYTLLVLLFEIIHLGVHPFSYTGGHGSNLINNCQENMQQRDFPYVKGRPPVDARGMYAPPEAKFIFSHMPKSLCDLFKTTFGKDEQGVCDYRPSIEEVIEKMEEYIRQVKNFEDNNQLRYNNFGMPEKNRVEFQCSHKDCRGHKNYRHIKYLLSRVEKASHNPNARIDRYLFCEKHLRNYQNILKMEKKASSEQERMEFRKVWQAQHEERDIVDIINHFFIQNPEHELKSNWENKLKINFFKNMNKQNNFPPNFNKNTRSTNPTQQTTRPTTNPTQQTTRPTSNPIPQPNNSTRTAKEKPKKNEKNSVILNFLNNLFK